MIKIYPALSPAIGGAGKGGWEQVQLDVAACHLPYWDPSSNVMLGCPFPHCWEAGRGGCKQMHLDVAGFHLPFWET